jgi:hypothetical protein
MLKYSFTVFLGYIYAISLYAQDFKTNYIPIENEGDISASQISSSN